MSFNKDNLEIYLKELAKEFRKLNGKKVPAKYRFYKNEFLFG